MAIHSVPSIGVGEGIEYVLIQRQFNRAENERKIE